MAIASTDTITDFNINRYKLKEQFLMKLLSGPFNIFYDVAN